MIRKKLIELNVLKCISEDIIDNQLEMCSKINAMSTNWIVLKDWPTFDSQKFRISKEIDENSQVYDITLAIKTA